MPEYRLKPRCKHFMRAPGKGLVRYGPGDKIEMLPHQAEKIKEKLESVPEQKAPAKTPPPKSETPPPTLNLVPVGGGKFNVVNSATKKAINEEPLSKEAAEALVSDQDKKE